MDDHTTRKPRSDSDDHRTVRELAADFAARDTRELEWLARRWGALEPDDAVQSGLLAFIRSFRVQGPAAPHQAHAYLARCVITAAYKQRRRAQRKPTRSLSRELGEALPIELVETLADEDAEDPEEAALRRAELARRSAAVRALPAEQRAVVVLGAAGYGVAETAAVLGLTPRQVRRAVGKAHRRLSQLGVEEGA